MRHSTSGAELYCVLVKPAHRLNYKLGARNFATKIFFAEWRPVIRPIDFLANEQDRALWIARSDRFRRRPGRQSTTRQQIFNVRFVHRSRPRASIFARSLPSTTFL